MRNAALISALAALAITVSGCGGGGSDETLTREEYAAAVTQICTASASKLRTLVAAAAGTNFLARKGDEFTAFASRNITRLKRLRPPPELADKAHQLVAGAEATRDRLIVLVRAAKKHPGSFGLGDTKLINSRHRMIEAANALGATC